MVPVDLMLGALLGYCWTGLEMVHMHSGSAPIDRPAYVRGSFYLKVSCGAQWPRICHLNREFGWFVSHFIAATIVTSVALALLATHLGYIVSVLLLGLILALPVPIISKVYFLIIGGASGIVWQLVSRLFRLQEPGWIKRFYQYQDAEMKRQQLYEALHRK